MADVFISYKREDRARVETLTGLLIDLELSVWFDAGIEVGAAWEARIMEEAEAAAAMVVCWSFAATASPWVKREAEVGLRRGVLVPVMLHWCAPVAPFDAIQAADLTKWDGAPDNVELQRVLQRIEQLTAKRDIARNARRRGGGRNEELVALLRQILVRRARAGDAPFTYREVEALLRGAAEAERIDMRDFDQHSLWGALDAIAEQNRARREPPLGALVVGKNAGLPGRGYFQKHVFLEGGHDDLERAVHERHLARVRASAWPQDP
ncbi:MAG: toll/interleukin-1 receptor domain-containing protein [Hyphomonadaceae bacterium]|nr:toll/interleukin-1 receptor domain-containing protein [Hyphomonadaceae bacterium]